MNDLIDRQKMICAIQKNRGANKADLIDAVYEVPTAETERDGGYWGWSDNAYETRVCSECEYDTEDYVEYNFCPNCGVLMSDLISRQAVIDFLKTVKSCLVEEDQIFVDCLISDVERLPPIDPEQKTGTWVESGDSDDWHCSECKFKMPWKDEKTPYCNNCGAKMEEKGE